MPILKREARHQAKQSKPQLRKRWEAFAMLWAVVGAKQAAEVLHEQLDRADKLIDHHNRTVAYWRQIREVRGEQLQGAHGMLVVELEHEIERTRMEIACYEPRRRMQPDYIECADPNESPTETERRLLLGLPDMTPHKLTETRRALGLVTVERDRPAELWRDAHLAKLEKYRGWMLDNTKTNLAPTDLEFARSEIARTSAEIDQLSGLRD